MNFSEFNAVDIQAPIKNLLVMVSNLPRAPDQTIVKEFEDKIGRGLTWW